MQRRGRASPSASAGADGSRAGPARRTCSRRSKGAGARARSEIVAVELRRSRRPAGARVPVGRAGRDSARRCARAQPVTDFVVRRRHLQRRRRLLLRHQHRTSRAPTPGELIGDGEVTFRHRPPRSRRGHLQAGRRGAPRRTARRTTTTGCCTRSASTSPLKETGIFRPPHRWTFSGGIRIDRACR